ncbi:TadE/TadG family type IV pilus assembly protein [Rhizobium sp. SSA_523]|uniref:TadE/TadG family type IV pilus assembly protein n=1 Tax=Rhizobium sp. SSA_523 TaxID=2952477 RepID=UPI0020916D4A|nr:TadE/TadG family type IV pilus assembly protein [Rhizobium sp. SSA_523]MCO5730007.1 pilus assembly protein TadG-related protein [Rhizobium sp. SSA_523]WKC25080.1 pilus assembly protein TadG-related protein [Rhizobium sp. SSA_523]
MRYLTILRKLWRSCDANFGMMTALLLPVLCMSAALAIDITHLNEQRSHLASATDAASLAVSEAYNAGTTDPDDLRDLARQFLDANLTANGGRHPPELEVSFAEGPPKSVMLKTSMPVELMLGGFFNHKSMPVSALASTTLGTKTYLQVAFLIDNSNSMALPGTQKDFDYWVRVNGCEFACHDPALAARGLEDGLAKARRLRVKMKMDFVRTALGQFTSKLEDAMDANANVVQMGIFTVATTFEEIAPMTADARAIQKALPNVEIEAVNPQRGIIGPEGGDGWTYLSQGLQILGTRLKNIGDGSSPNKRKTYLVFMTDGVDSYPPYRTFGIVYGPKCEGLKQKGISILTVQTFYPPSNDVQLKQSLKRIPKVLRDCASSPNDYVMADDGPRIQEAVDQIYNKIFRSTRILR